MRRKREVKKTLQREGERNRGNQEQNNGLGDNRAKVQLNTSKHSRRRRKTKLGKRTMDNAQDGKEQIKRTEKKKRVNKGNRRASKKGKIRKNSKKTLKRKKATEREKQNRGNNKDSKNVVKHTREEKKRKNKVRQVHGGLKRRKNKRKSLDLSSKKKNTKIHLKKSKAVKEHEGKRGNEEEKGKGADKRKKDKLQNQNKRKSKKRKGKDKEVVAATENGEAPERGEFNKFPNLVRLGYTQWIFFFLIFNKSLRPRFIKKNT